MSTVHIQQFKSWITKNKIEPLMRWFQEQKTQEALHWRELGEQVYLHHPEPMTFLLQFTSDYIKKEQQALSALQQYSARHMDTSRSAIEFKQIYSGLSGHPSDLYQNTWSLVTHASLEDKQRWTAQWMQHLDNVPSANITRPQRIDLERPFLEWCFHERYLPLIISRIGVLDEVYRDDVFIRSYLRHGHPDDWNIFRNALIDKAQSVEAFQQLLWTTSWRLLSVEPTPYPLTSAFLEFNSKHDNILPPLLGRFRNSGFIPVESLKELNTCDGDKLDSAVFWTLLKTVPHNADILRYAETEWSTLNALTPEETLRYQTMAIAVSMEVSKTDLPILWDNSRAPSLTEYPILFDEQKTEPF